MAEMLAAAFARAVAEKDDAGMRALLHPEICFQGLTPRWTWAGASPDEVIDVLGTWFSETDVIESVEQVETDEFADRQRAGYRFLIRTRTVCTARAAGLPVRAGRPYRLAAHRLLRLPSRGLSGYGDGGR